MTEASSHSYPLLLDLTYHLVHGGGRGVSPTRVPRWIEPGITTQDHGLLIHQPLGMDGRSLVLQIFCLNSLLPNLRTPFIHDGPGIHALKGWACIPTILIPRSTCSHPRPIHEPPVDGRSPPILRLHT
jgi:hypothetical protein